MISVVLIWKDYGNYAGIILGIMQGIANQLLRSHFTKDAYVLYCTILLTTTFYW